MTAVFAPAAAYRVAVAELPRSSRLVDGPDGAVAVVPGAEGWIDAASAAASAGAVAVVVADPVFVPSGEFGRIAETGIPIIIERPLLRPDVAADAVAARTAAPGGRPARMIMAEAAASREHLTAVVRDAVGWLRTLAGETPAIVVADPGLALLQTRAGIAATPTIAVTTRSDTARIRAQALGEVITDLEARGRSVLLATSSAAGRLIAPPRFESSERLALRRAIEAVAQHTVPGDLADLRADTALVEALRAVPA